MLKNIELSELDFKVNGDDSTNYLTHNFHSYPAKFIPQIPRKTIELFTASGDLILDPFCGCGTTLVEAKLSGRHSVGIDLNPIAVLVSKAKTSKLSEPEIEIIHGLLLTTERDIKDFYDGKYKGRITIPEFNNRDHWFQRNVLNELAIIKQNIEEIHNEKINTFLKCAFSSIIVGVSNQESNTRYAAKNKSIADFKTLHDFIRKTKDMERRIIEYSKKASDSKVKVFQGDTRKVDFLKDNSADHIVTSPPYANTYDYYLYHKMRMYWLGYEMEGVRDNEIGSRNRYSSKKEDPQTFMADLTHCFTEMSRILKPDKYAVVVIGDSVVRKNLIKINQEIRNICKETPFEYIKEISYNLKKNSRMFNPKFTNGDKLEHIIFLKNRK